MDHPDLIGLDKPVQERRRTMKSGQVKRTPLGDVKFRLVVDLPANFPEDQFKKVMVEYGNIIREAFENS